MSEIDRDFQGSMVQVAADGELNYSEVFPERPREKVLGRPDYPIVFGQEGTYVDLIDRAELLQDALSAFSQRNSRLGFAVCSRAPEHRGEVYARYHRFVPNVQRGAARNGDEFYDVARHAFWKATGFSAMRGTGLMEDGEIDSRAILMWEKFQDAHKSPDSFENRSKYRRSLDKSLKLSKAILDRVMPVASKTDHAEAA